MDGWMDESQLSGYGEQKLNGWMILRGRCNARQNALLNFPHREKSKPAKPCLAGTHVGDGWLLLPLRESFLPSYDRNYGSRDVER
jgi:hypothetical protein